MTELELLQLGSNGFTGQVPDLLQLVLLEADHSSCSLAKSGLCIPSLDFISNCYIGNLTICDETITISTLTEKDTSKSESEQELEGTNGWAGTLSFWIWLLVLAVVILVISAPAVWKRLKKKKTDVEKDNKVADRTDNVV
jgi:hypothetical protein